MKQRADASAVCVPPCKHVKKCNFGKQDITACRRMHVFRSPQLAATLRSTKGREVFVTHHSPCALGGTGRRHSPCVSPLWLRRSSRGRSAAGSARRQRRRTQREAPRSRQCCSLLARRRGRGRPPSQGSPAPRPTTQPAEPHESRGRQGDRRRWQQRVRSTAAAATVKSPSRSEEAAARARRRGAARRQRRQVQPGQARPQVVQV